MGELLKKVPKASGGDRRSEDFKISPRVDFEKSKSEVIKESGLSQRQAEHFQLMAKYPEYVEIAKNQADLRPYSWRERDPAARVPA